MSLDHEFQTSEKIHVATQKMSKSGFLWNDKKSKIAYYRAEIQRHECQADYDRRSIQKLNGVIESQRGEICRAHQGDEQHRRDQEQNRELREAHEKSLHEMEELKRFQGSTFGTISRRRLIEDQDTVLELTAKIQELQNEVECLNDSREFKDAGSARSGQSHVTSLSRLDEEFNPWISNVTEHTSPHVMSECQTPAQDQRCQSGQSPRN